MQYRQLQKSWTNIYLGDIIDCLSTSTVASTFLTTQVEVHSCMIETDCLMEDELTHRNKLESDNKGQSNSFINGVPNESIVSNI